MSGINHRERQYDPRINLFQRNRKKILIFTTKNVNPCNKKKNKNNEEESDVKRDV